MLQIRIHKQDTYFDTNSSFKAKMYPNLCPWYVYLHMEILLFLYYVVREVMGVEAEYESND